MSVPDIKGFGQTRLDAIEVADTMNHSRANKFTLTSLLGNVFAGYMNKRVVRQTSVFHPACSKQLPGRKESRLRHRYRIHQRLITRYHGHQNSGETVDYVSRSHM